MTSGEDRTLIILIVAMSIAFVWILLPFYSAILWVVVLAVIFTPAYRIILVWTHGRSSLSAGLVVLLVILIVIVPLALLTSTLLLEASSLIESVRSGELNIGQHLKRIVGLMPSWAMDFVERFNLNDADQLQEQLSEAAVGAGRFIAAQAVNIGQNTFELFVSLFIMIYLLFFFVRDGDAIARRVRNAIPMSTDSKEALLSKFAVVIRATIKGDLVVALVQGALGGFVFWLLEIRAPLLWGVVMAVLSLLPAIGSALVWVPVDLLPNLSPFIRRVCSSFAPAWGVLRTQLV